MKGYIMNLENINKLAPILSDLYSYLVGMNRLQLAHLLESFDFIVTNDEIEYKKYNKMIDEKLLSHYENLKKELDEKISTLNQTELNLLKNGISAMINSLIERNLYFGR